LHAIAVLNIHTMRNNDTGLKQLLPLIEKGLLFLPLITAISYLGAYFFEMAFLTTYNVSARFIQIKTENFIFLLLSSAAVCAIVSVAFDAYKHNWQGQGKIRKVLFLASFGIPLSLWLLLALPPFMSAGLFIAILILAVLWRFAPNAFETKSAENYSTAQGVIIVSILTVSAVCILSYMAGRLWAMNQDNYAVIFMNDKKYAVVQSYGDTSIVVSADPNDDEFMVLTTDEISNKTLHTEKLEIGNFSWSKWVDDAF
jgi:hypothetical protein